MTNQERPTQGIVNGVTRVASASVAAMGSSPLSLALLLVNVAFLGFAGYILGEVAENARERNKTQNELIVSLVHDIRDCRAAPAKPAPTVEPIAEPGTAETSPTGQPR